MMAAARIVFMRQFPGAVDDDGTIAAKPETIKPRTGAGLFMGYLVLFCLNFGGFINYFNAIWAAIVGE